MAELDYNTLQLLADDISKEFKNIKVIVGPSLVQSEEATVFQSAFSDIESSGTLLSYYKVS